MTDTLIKQALSEFVAERDWEKFHSLDNLAKSISIEAAELLELFQWGSPSDIAKIRDELADVLTYCHLMAMKLDLDSEDIVLEKLQETKLKYPVDKAKGVSTKYDEL